MNMIIIINNVRYEVGNRTVEVKEQFPVTPVLYNNHVVLNMNEAEFFQAMTVDPHIYIVRELIKLKEKIK